MCEPTKPHVPGRGSNPWLPPGLDSSNPCVLIPDTRYRLVWISANGDFVQPQAGGMGQVYLAEHVETGETVCAKFFDPRGLAPTDPA
jgi:hypothetical protein